MRSVLGVRGEVRRPARTAVGRTCLILLTSLLLVGLLAGTASAETTGESYEAPIGGPIPQTTHVKHSQTTQPAIGVIPLITCPFTNAKGELEPNPLCNMTYHSGPVLHTNTTHVIYWEPPGSTVSANYHSLINQFLGDVAGDSGRATNPYAVATQYSDTTNGNLLYKSTFAGALTDTNAFPARLAACKLTGPATACLTRPQQENELDSFLKANSLPRGEENIYFLVLPQDVDTCDSNSGQAGGGCGPYSSGKKGGYCAYHTEFNKGNGLTTWANEPYAAGGSCYGAITKPNNDDADILINTMSHEHNEAVTDPNAGGGWFDATLGGENGDKCAYNFGPPIGQTGGGVGYDVLINHHTYDLQQEWSNAITGCAMNYQAVPPTALFTYSPPSPIALDTVNFDGTSSHSNDAGGYIINWSWQFGDGGTGTGATASHVYGAAGMYTVTLTVTDDAGLTDTTTQTVTVGTRATTLAYTGPNNGDYDDPVTFSAHLSDTVTSAPIGGRSITFKLGGGETCMGTTNSSGDASCMVTLTQTPGADTVTASFAGDSVYTGSSDSKPFTVNKEESTLTYTGATTSDYHDVFTASAILREDSSGPLLAGRSVTFTLGVGDTCTATTNGAGEASCPIKPTQVGPLSIVASFAGDAFYLPSGATKPFAVTPEETTMTYTGPTLILAGSGGATLTANMVEDGANDNDGDGGSSAPFPAQVVTLSIGTQSCTGTTDASGNVSCTIPSVTVPLGPETVGASFAGDAYYATSSAQKQAIVFAFPPYGAFALGDKTVAAATPSTSVTWYWDTWRQPNVLSGGGAPDEFQGFIKNITLPTTSPPTQCASSWTTPRYVNSSQVPLHSIPSYMGTIVTSSVNRVANTIYGNSVGIVIVKTDPGAYKNPPLRGTGTIVATFC